MWGLRDPGAGFSLEQVIAADRAGRFTPLPDNLSLGYTTDAYWLRFDLRRPAEAPAEWWLEVLPAMLDHLTLYVPQADGSYLDRHSGDALPITAHDIDYRFSVFRFQVPAGNSSFYLRIVTNSTFTAQPTLWQPSAFAHQVALEGSLLGLLFGMLLLTLLFNLIFWLWFREALFRAYVLHLSALALGFATSYGYAYQYGLSAWPTVNDLLTYISTLLITAATSWYFTVFIKLKQLFPRLDRLYRGLAMFALLAIVPTLLGLFPLLSKPLFTINSLMVLLCFAISFRLWSRREADTRLFIAAFTVFNIGVVAINLRNLGFLAPGLVTNNAVLIGTAIHIIILHLALARRVRDAEQAKLQAQAEALAISQRSALELEQKVHQRTSELSASNQALQDNQSELRAAQEQAEAAAAIERQALEEEGHLLELIAHEFRSPLAIIGNTAQTLRRIKEGELAQVRSKGERIFSAVTRLANVIDNCLSDARLNSLDRPLQPVSLVLAEIIARATASYGQDMLHQWHIDLPHKQLRIDADPVLLELALSNLLDNAAKYAPSGSKIEVSTSFDNRQVGIEIRDHGPGIPLDSQDDIFKKFTRGQPSATGKSPPGAGLGLFLVKRIALLHGGDIVLKSTPGAGTSFTLVLPMP